MERVKKSRRMDSIRLRNESRKLDRSIRIAIASGLASPMTELTSSRLTSRPAALSALCKQRFTESSSFTVVPAISKTTSSIFMGPSGFAVLRSTIAFAQFSCDDGFGQPERQRHSSPAHSSDDRRLGRRMDDEKGFPE